MGSNIITLIGVQICTNTLSQNEKPTLSTNLTVNVSVCVMRTLTISTILIFAFAKSRISCFYVRRLQKSFCVSPNIM